MNHPTVAKFKFRHHKKQYIHEVEVRYDVSSPVVTDLLNSSNLETSGYAHTFENIWYRHYLVVIHKQMFMTHSQSYKGLCF